MFYKLRSYTASPIALSYHDQGGPELVAQIQQWVSTYDSEVTIICTQMQLITVAYATQLLSELCGAIGVEKAKALVQFSEIDELNTRVVAMSWLHVMQFWLDPEYQAAIDGAREKLEAKYEAEG